ncbi:class E sortase [Litorihabitans aurantiacus]|uniref:Class E sortase n=1 Tax=Litorihabitans aurantiacus TaxID=1930061 RepID=A0AA37UGU6_9MICO|nr:class E sortase [Litorihabitans aurantiacus]GMA30393.1 hypothetical protein GCM10025875_03850 [Litorihabitans aurantiacus]
MVAPRWGTSTDRRPLRVAGIALACAAALAACTPDAPEATPPSPTASPVALAPTAPDPTPTAPPPPRRAPEPPPVQERQEIGATYGTVTIDRFGEEWVMPLHEGVDKAIIDRPGIAHYPDSATPGSFGNIALTGHRTTHSAPLYDIDLLEAGDRITVTTATGEFTYEVTTHEIVNPDAMRVISPNPQSPDSPAETSMLTLIACHPKGSVAQRWVTYAELVGSASV